MPHIYNDYKLKKVSARSLCAAPSGSVLLWLHSSKIITIDLSDLLK
jgi:hypothetical protein